MKRLLFLLHTPPPVHGASVVGQFVKESKVINSLFDCRFINLGTSRRIDEIGRKPIKKLFRFLSVITNSIKETLVFRPQLVYLTIAVKGLAFYKDVLVVLVFRVFRVSVVYHFHNKGVEGFGVNPVNNFIYRVVFSDSYAILLSQSLVSDVKRYFNPDDIYICPNGIPCLSVDSFLFEDCDSGVCRILFLSNLIESKGVYVLLDACKLLKDQGVAFVCDYVGGEGDVSFSVLNRRIQELALDDCVKVRGPKYAAEKEHELKTANLFVFPTFYHNECFPLVILEAMQAGLPVISTKEGAIPDIIIDGKTGFLVEQRNARCLADKIKELIKDERLRRDMGIAAKSRFEKNFTLEIFEKRLCEIFDNILDKV